MGLRRSHGVKLITRLPAQHQLTKIRSFLWMAFKNVILCDDERFLRFECAVLLKLKRYVIHRGADLLFSLMGVQRRGGNIRILYGDVKENAVFFQVFIIGNIVA